MDGPRGLQGDPLRRVVEAGGDPGVTDPPQRETGGEPDACVLVAGQSRDLVGRRGAGEPHHEGMPQGRVALDVGGRHADERTDNRRVVAAAVAEPSGGDRRGSPHLGMLVAEQPQEAAANRRSATRLGRQLAE